MLVEFLEKGKLKIIKLNLEKGKLKIIKLNLEKGKLKIIKLNLEKGKLKPTLSMSYAVEGNFFFFILKANR